MKPLARLFAVLLPVVLTGCLLTPGKFVSTLTINADRSFTYAYQGEVIATDLTSAMANSMKGMGKDGKAGADDTATEDAAKTADTERKNREIAAALSKEAGYRKVDYLGGGRFMVDYLIAGRLTHNFIYPFNVDAEAIIPFVAVELRSNGTVRVKAPAFAKDAGIGNSAGLSDAGPSAKMEGTFTLDTDAGVVSQNNEGGVTNAGARKRIVWAVTPLSKEAPSAVLQLQ